MAALQTADLLARVDALSGPLLGVRGALAWCMPAVSAARSNRRSDDAVGLATLPRAVALHIFSYVPADACARAALVCRAWRDLIAEPCFWTELDLSSTSGVVAKVTRQMLLAAAARAGGQLERLHVTYATFLPEVLQAVFAANMNTLLRLLRLEQSATDPYAQEAVLRAAPPQCVVEADAFEMYESVQPMLRNQPPFQALRLRQLKLAGGVWRDAPAQVAALAVDLAAHPSLRAVLLWMAPLDSLAALEAVVDAALALRLTKLLLENCRVSPASAVALPRLLRGDALRDLGLTGPWTRMLQRCWPTRCAATAR